LQRGAHRNITSLFCLQLFFLSLSLEVLEFN
jgi:hypothetical protein